MSDVTILKADVREKTGKGVARRLRMEGRIPAIIYGGKKDEIKISTNLKEIYLEFLRGNFSSKLLDIDLGNDKVRVVPREVQLHPVTDKPIHVDFLRVDNDTKINVFVKVKFLNADKAPGLKRGGVLNTIRREIELTCRADSIPTCLELDLEGLMIGESVHSHSINYPEGVEPTITGRDFTIAAIVGRASETAADEVIADEAEDEEADGEDE